jgi:hypothetical protein
MTALLNGDAHLRVSEGTSRRASSAPRRAGSASEEVNSEARIPGAAFGIPKDSF